MTVAAVSRTRRQHRVVCIPDLLLLLGADGQEARMHPARQRRKTPPLGILASTSAYFLYHKAILTSRYEQHPETDADAQPGQ